MPGPFSRTELLLGEQAMIALAQAHVAVFGIGGVGGYVVEALARCGVGALTLVDSDTIAESNLNRQIIATRETIGQYKVDAMAERIASVSPNCCVDTRRCFFLPETAASFEFGRFSYVVDAVDTVTAKLALVQAAQAAGVPVISAMGAANKLDPTRFEVASIYDTSIDPLARVIRKECRKRGIAPFKVVYSREPALPVLGDAAELAELQAGDSSRRSLPGSIAFVPAAAGLAIAAEVVKDLIAKE